MKWQAPVIALCFFGACTRPAPTYLEAPDLGQLPPTPVCATPTPAAPSVPRQLSSGGGRVTVASDGCGAIYVAWPVADEDQTSQVHLVSSADSGNTFSEPVVVGEGIDPFLFIDGLGRPHLVANANGTVTHRRLADGGGEEAHLVVEGSALFVRGEVIVHRVAEARGADEVAVTWRTADPAAIWFATSVSGQFVLTPLARSDGDLLPPRLCLGGEKRVVVVWVERAPASSGIFAAVSEDAGGGFVVSRLGAAHQGPGEGGFSTGGGVEVACAEDGRAIATWTTAERTIQTAALDAWGTWQPGDVLGDSGGFSAPYYPKQAVSRDRVLVAWLRRFGGSSGYAVLDLSARVVAGPVEGPDLDGDGENDRFLRVCAFGDDGFGILGQARHSHSDNDNTGPGLLIRLAPDGQVSRTETLGPYSETAVNADLACDRRGLGFAVWQEAGDLVLTPSSP